MNQEVTIPVYEHAIYRPENPTSPSLIIGIKEMDQSSWERMSRIYVPVVMQWVRNANLQVSDASDVVQEVFRAAAKSISKFESGNGLPPFRAWLRGITRHKVMDHFRRKSKLPHADGGTNAHQQFLQLPDEFSDSTEADSNTSPARRALALRAINLMKTDFREKTWRAFWRVTIEQERPADVAEDLGISVASVYTAKSRVLAHPRAELEGLV